MRFIVHGGAGLTTCADFITQYPPTLAHYGFESLEVGAMICVFGREQC